jgi:hypothetical protein
MAQIRLRKGETDAEHLPMVCMVCGEPATTHVRRKFTWAPEWLSILAFSVVVAGTVLAALVVILYFAFRKRMLVEVPTCDRHHGYWRRRLLWAYLPLMVVMIAGGGELIFMLSMDEGPDQESMYGPCFGTVVGAFMCLVIAAVLLTSTVRAASIGDRGITIKKVDERFVQALIAKRRAEREKAEEDLDDDLPRALPAEPDNDPGIDETSFRPK